MAQTGEGVSSFFGKDLDLSASVLVWDKLSRCPGESHFVPPGKQIPEGNQKGPEDFVVIPSRGSGL